MSDFRDLKSLAFRRPLPVGLVKASRQDQSTSEEIRGTEEDEVCSPLNPLQSGFQPTTEPTGFQPVGGSVDRSTTVKLQPWRMLT